MKIYVVRAGDFDGDSIEGIYRSKAKADFVADSMREESELYKVWAIEQWRKWKKTTTEIIMKVCRRN